MIRSHSIHPVSGCSRYAIPLCHRLRRSSECISWGSQGYGKAAARAPCLVSIAGNQILVFKQMV